jgi:LPXTG-site transpeptidase (sortase) family protein
MVLRIRSSAPLLSQVLLGILLVLTLGFAGRDGAPHDPDPDAAGRLSATPLFAQAVPGVGSLSGLARTTEVSVSYKVLIPKAPPVQLLIPSLDVHRPVEAVGVDRSGVLNLPVNFWNAGWYYGGPVPGAPGDAVIEGHAGFPGEPLIFGKLLTLKQGDRIVVVLGDGTRRLFLVESMAKVPVGTAPAGMGEPYGPPRLTLITCTGYFNKNSYSYSERLVVEASYAGLV